MNRLRSLKRRLQAGAGLALVTAALYAASLAFVAAADTPPEKKTAKKTEKAPAATASKTKKLTGGELYSINCNRCHPERYPTEWNPAQWKTLMLHMRVRANLPAKQAKEILKYLQEDAGN